MRLLLIPFVVVALLLLFGTSSQIYSAGEPILQDFDINRCYSRCPCPWGPAQDCFDCKQRCERKSWEDFDKSTSEKSQKNDDED
jgi:hypothetical protein